MTIAVVLTAQQAPPSQDAPEAQAPADEPGRAVARVSVLSGDASVTRGDAGTPVAAAVNAPLMAGDSLSVAPGATVEVQMDGANFVRVAGDSQIRISSLDNGKYQIQLAKGLVTYRVLRQTNAQSEVDTPLIAVHPLGLSSVRVEVAPDGSTRVTVRHGAVDVYTPKGTERVNEGSTMMVRGSADDPEFQVVSGLAVDQWDTWNDQRDTYLSRAQSPQYASPDVVGTEDLDNYGRWSNDPQYGNVWTPTVPATWAPYRNGQWVWEDYYGWTWVDYSPWGWAPFHYGSWYFRTGFGWSWFPGPRFGHYWYRPALVGFVGFGGGFGVGFGFGSVGWIPLAPFEAFRPWYGAGWYGGGRIVNNINIVRNVNVIGVYRNARFANGVTAVSSADFQRGNFRNPVAVDRAQLSQASLVRGAVPVTPTASNLAFGNRGGAAVGPQNNINNQRFYSRMTPGGAAAQRTPFNQQAASVHSAFQSRGIQTGAAPSGLSGGAEARAGAMPAARSASPGAGGGASAQWQRFGSSPSGAGNSYGGQSRPLQVAPPMVRQREAGQGYGGSQSSGFRGGAAPQSAPAYRGGAAPQPAPAYRSAPAPSRSAPSRSAPAAAPRSGGGGGSSHSGGSGGHSGGRR